MDGSSSNMMIEFETNGGRLSDDHFKLTTSS